MHQRRYELFVRMVHGQSRLLELLDKDRQAFSGINTGWNAGYSNTMGWFVWRTTRQALIGLRASLQNPSCWITRWQIKNMERQLR